MDIALCKNDDDIIFITNVKEYQDLWEVPPDIIVNIVYIFHKNTIKILILHWDEINISFPNDFEVMYDNETGVYYIFIPDTYEQI